MDRFDDLRGRRGSGYKRSKDPSKHRAVDRQHEEREANKYWIVVNGARCLALEEVNAAHFSVFQAPS
jgi:hypothetical protein